MKKEYIAIIKTNTGTDVRILPCNSMAQAIEYVKSTYTTTCRIIEVSDSVVL